MTLIQKPISTISYNTKEFLITKLQRLLSAGIFSYALCIYHKGEKEIDDFTGDYTTDKDHWHIYMNLAKRVELKELKKEFIELDLKDNNKSLGCMNFQPSKIGHWLCYVVHKVEYLAIYKTAEMNKEYTYKLDDLITFGLIDNELQRLWKENAKPLYVIKDAIAYKALGGRRDKVEKAITMVGVQKGIALVAVTDREQDFGKFPILMEEIKELRKITEKSDEK